MTSLAIALALASGWTYADCSAIPAPSNTPPPKTTAAAFPAATFEYPQDLLRRAMSKLSAPPEEPRHEDEHPPDPRPEPKPAPEPRPTVPERRWIWYPQFRKYGWGYQGADGKYYIEQWR
ncbi:hypothetical protein [Singulisphaera sp. PoT]|uniref:hypothetical protein n=1 Tax=Singulisphaera sp. PoT TaxID=3411797 RepID=UPI003BF4B367